MTQGRILVPTRFGKMTFRDHDPVTQAIPVTNTGTQALPNGQTLDVKCLVVSGGPACPVADSTQVLPSIKGSSTKQITLVATEGAQPGDYKVSFVLKNKKGRPPSVNLHVCKPLTFKVPKQ